MINMPDMNNDILTPFMVWSVSMSEEIILVDDRAGGQEPDSELSELVDLAVEHMDMVGLARLSEWMKENGYTPDCIDVELEIHASYYEGR